MDHRSDEQLPRLSESGFRSTAGLLGHRVAWGFGVLLMLGALWVTRNFGADTTDTIAAALPLLLIAVSTWPGLSPGVRWQVIFGVGLILWLAVAFVGVDGMELRGVWVLHLSAAYLFVSAMGVVMTSGSSLASPADTDSRRASNLSWVFALVVYELLALAVTGGFASPLGAKGEGLLVILIAYAVIRLLIGWRNRRKRPDLD